GDCNARDLDPAQKKFNSRLVSPTIKARHNKESWRAFFLCSATTCASLAFSLLFLASRDATPHLGSTVGKAGKFSKIVPFFVAIAAQTCTVTYDIRHKGVPV